MRTVKGTIVLAISILVAVVFTGFGLFIYDEVRIADLTRMDGRLQSHADKLHEEIEEQIDEHRFPDITDLTTLKTEGLAGVVFGLYDAAGTVLYADSVFLTTDGPGNHARVLSPGIADFTSNRIRFRSLKEPAADIDSVAYTLQVAAPLADVDTDLAHLRSLLMIAIPVLVIFSALLVYTIVRRSLAPITTMIQSAEGISAGTLHERLALPVGKDEVFALGSALNRMMERIESAFKVQKQFVADASHEIRTPLSIIQSDLDFVRRHITDPSSKESLASAMAETDHLKELTADILLLAQLDAVSVQLNIQSIRLDEWLADCVKRMTSVAAGNSIALELHIDTPLEINADGTRMESVCLNLIENAIKYSSPGGKVCVSLKESGGFAELAVKDSGAGIPAEEIPLIFTRFHRGASARTACAGSGLGLAIAQRIVELHHGTIIVESEIGRGTSFTVSLPLPS